MRTRYGAEPKARTRALASLRRGSHGDLRAHVRCMLLDVMGFESCEQIPFGYVPGHFPRAGAAITRRIRDVAHVAYDGLLDLGYDAAANALRDRGRDLRFESGYLPVHARDALQIFEAGPPSIELDTMIVFRSPMYRFRGTKWNPNTEVLIAKQIDRPSRPWVRFLVGIEGRYDRSQNIHAATFHKTLKDAKNYEAPEGGRRDARRRVRRR